MIIESGKFKSLKLECLAGQEGHRPTGSKVRGAFASMVANVWDEFPNPKILDLFAGSGAVGLSLASVLDSASITFIESHPKVQEYLRKNIKKITSDQELAQHADFAVESLDLLKKSSYSQIDKNFQIVFADPPYAITKEYLTTMFDTLAYLVDEGGWFALELAVSDFKDISQVDFGVDWALQRKKKYGSSAIIVWEKSGNKREKEKK